MRVLIVDNSTETQAICAKRVDSFSKSDKEMLDLKVRLVNDKDFIGRLSEAEVLLIGAGLSGEAVSIARRARMEAPWIQIVMFVSDREYGGGAFRSAHAVGVRKVFPDSATSLDLLQELVAIHADFRKEGRTYDGKVVVVLHAKGGVGATSIAAALGEVCSNNQRRTLLWDLDVETKDLSRSLAASGPEAKIISGWVNGSRDITRESFRDALIPIASDVSVLTSPDRFAESMDLVCHADGMEIAQRIVELAKVLFDTIVIDTAGRMGPAVGGILRNADIALIVSDDTELALTATDLLLASIKPLIGGTDRIRFLIKASSDKPVNLKQIASDLESVHELPESAWALPALPLDSSVATWPGSGNTLYSASNKELTKIFVDMVSELGLVGPDKKDAAQQSSAEEEQEELQAQGGWFKRLFR
jgi:cellulose biosynthesis protein BcsQ